LAAPFHNIYSNRKVKPLFWFKYPKKVDLPILLWTSTNAAVFPPDINLNPKHNLSYFNNMLHLFN